MEPSHFVLLGMIAMASVTIGLFFLRFWKVTKDRFFLFFAASFLIEGFNRFFFGILSVINEDSAIHYLVRLLAYGLILAAIVDKNLPSSQKK